MFPNAVLVTGAASGIGLALSRALAGAGTVVVGLDRARSNRRSASIPSPPI
jgi:NAD(P)-dependent dehydrogenase (short-subunit alcohol dehydrogenase family)